MDRFTFYVDDYAAVKGCNCYEDQSVHLCGPAIDRLAEYENTGLMPQEVAEMAALLQDARQQRDEVTQVLAELAKCQNRVCTLLQGDEKILQLTDMISETAQLLGELRSSPAEEFE